MQCTMKEANTVGFPWYLKPDLFLHAEMLDKQEELESAANSSYATDQGRTRRSSP